MIVLFALLTLAGLLLLFAPSLLIGWLCGLITEIITGRKDP